MLKNRPQVVEKRLSANDTGETGSHQAGLLVPKTGEVLPFFPDLDASEKNPRRILTFTDEFGEKWEFVFIYYNNSQFGGTRNEYRLTCMTDFFRRYNLHAGDTIRLHRTAESKLAITFSRAKQASAPVEPGKLRLAAQWRVIKI